MTVSPKLELEGGESSLEVRRVSAHERMSELFVVDVLARSTDPHIDLSGIVGKGAGVASETLSGLVAWTGVCSYMEQAKPAEEETGHSTYLLRIVPALWLLSQRRNHRIFQHEKTPDIVKKILGEYQIEPTLELTAEYPRHEYCVQYGESDFAFVSRLLEQAGISYYFRRVKVGDKAKSLLVLTDAPQRGESIAAINYYDTPNEGQLDTPYITDVHVGHGVRPGKSTVRDYDFRKPRLQLRDSSSLSLEDGEKIEDKYERYHYVPGVSLFEADSADDKVEVADDKSIARHLPKHNKAWADRQAEAERHQKRRVGFRTNHGKIAPAQIFTIDHHPRNQLENEKLMVVELDTFITELDWTLTGTAVFAKAPYRPLTRTPKPRVAGVQTAMVVGPPGQEIYTDEFGRVRVRFHWDREGKFDDNSTCWLRVSQAWAGASFGTMHVPRIGQEVIVDYLDGDPDQPLVVGRVFNATTRVPRKLPEHKTQSIWRSATSPQTGGKFNEIMFDDAAGKELYFMQAERDLLRLTKRNDTERTGEDRTIVVGEGRVTAVATSDSLQVGKQHLIKMVKTGDLHIPDMGEPEVTPLDTFVEMVDRKITLTTGKATIQLDGPNITIDAKGGLRFTTDGRLIMKGSMVYLNVMPGQAEPQADAKPKDAVAKPDRMLGSVKQLFWQPYEAQVERRDQEVSLPKKPAPDKLPKACQYLQNQPTVEGTPEDWNRLRKKWRATGGERVQHEFKGDAAPRDALKFQAHVGGKEIPMYIPMHGTSDAAQQLATPNQIAQALAVLPKPQLDAVDAVEVSPKPNPDDAYWAKEFKVPGFASGASAGDPIKYYPAGGHDQSYLDSTIIHEAGHNLHGKLWTDAAAKQRWADAAKADGNFPSKYAEDAFKGNGTYNEDFAESLVGYSLAKGTPCEAHGRRLYPNRYKELDSLSTPPAKKP